MLYFLLRTLKTQALFLGDKRLEVFYIFLHYEMQHIFTKFQDNLCHALYLWYLPKFHLFRHSYIIAYKLV